MIRAGRTGRLLSTEAIFNTSSPFVRNPANHLFSRELQGGGILLWLGIHDIDQLLWLTGERIVEVQAMSGQVNDAGIGVEDAMSIAVRYESGALGTVHCAYVLPRTLSDGYVAVRGSRGAVRVSFDGTVDVVGPGGVADPLVDERITSTNARVAGYGPYAQAAIADLLDAIAEDRDPLATGEQLVDALRVIDAAYESARTRRPVLVDWTN
jgi:predicted dehydrogenase